MTGQLPPKVRITLGLLSIGIGLFFMYLFLVFFALGGGSSPILLLLVEAPIILFVIFGFCIMSNRLNHRTYLMGGIGSLPIVVFILYNIWSGLVTSMYDPSALLSRGKPQAVIDIYTKEIQSGNEQHREDRADLFYTLGQYQSALDDYHQIAQPPYDKLAITHYRMKNLHEAIAAAQQYKTSWLLGGIHSDQHNYPAALAVYQQILTEDITDLKSRQLKGEYKKDNKFGQMVFAQLARGQSIKPDAYLAIANTFAQQHSDQEALQYYNMAIEVETAYEKVYDQEAQDSFIGRGNFYLYKSDYQSAIADFSRALDNDPNSLKPYLGRATAAALAGNLDQAKADIDYASEVESGWDDLDILNLKAVIYQQLNLTSEAQKIIKQREHTEETIATEDSYFQLTNKNTLDIRRIENAHQLIPAYADFLQNRL